jgi:hypothetical protein
VNLTSRFRSDLWRRLAEAQDACASDLGDRPLRDIGLALTARLAAPSRGARLRHRLPVMAIGLGALVAVVFLAGVLTRDVAFRQTAGPPLSLYSARGAAERRLGERAYTERAYAEQAFVADARSDLPLHFADGSNVTFRAGSAGHIQRFTGAGAEIVLERGRLEAQVVHADTTLWLLHAGPYRVRVTGTRFAMTWAAANLEVDLYEGAVVIDGAVLGAGVPLRAGQRLKIESGTVVVEPLEAPSLLAVASTRSSQAVAPNPLPSTAEAPGPTPLSDAGETRNDDVSDMHLGPSPVPGRDSTSRTTDQSFVRPGVRSSGGRFDDQWLKLAERGAYREALSAAKRLGWSDLCRHLDARRLLTLGDVARYSGAHARAKQAFESLVTRFPEDRLAADAVFSLGRLAFESRHPDEAARWFGRYVSDWPLAPLADQAAGRLLECAIRVDDREAARNAARRYLARAPGGPHARLAREVLEQPPDGPP